MNGLLIRLNGLAEEKYFLFIMSPWGLHSNGRELLARIVEITAVNGAGRPFPRSASVFPPIKLSIPLKKCVNLDFLKQFLFRLC